MISFIKNIFFGFIFLNVFLFAKQESTKEIQNKIDNQSQELNQLRLEIEEIENKINSQKNEAENVEATGFKNKINRKIDSVIK